MTKPSDFNLGQIRTYTRQWLQHHDIQILPSGTLKNPGNKPKHELLGSLYVDYEEGRRAHNAKVDKNSKLQGYERGMFADVLAELIREERNKAIAAMLAEIRCDTEDLAPLSDFLFRLTGRRDETDLGVVAHWIACVKRKMLGLPVHWHIMPILTGAQGVGKSTAIKHLLRAIKDVQVQFKLDEISDPRCVFSLETHFVMVFDEMQGAKRVEVEKLKNIITAESVGGRPMRSNDVIDVPVNTMFIGSTNKDIATLIKDETGMRRFYDLKCSSDPIRGTDTIDCAALWRGVDESKIDDYILSVNESLAIAQAELVVQDDVVLFLEATGITPQEGERPAQISLRTLYGDYTAYCDHHNYHAKPCNMFGRALTRLGFTSKRVRDAGANLIHYHISPSGKAKLKSQQNGERDEAIG